MQALGPEDRRGARESQKFESKFKRRMQKPWSAETTSNNCSSAGALAHCCSMPGRDSGTLLRKIALVLFKHS